MQEIILGTKQRLHAILIDPQLKRQPSKIWIFIQIMQKLRGAGEMREDSYYSCNCVQCGIIYMVLAGGMGTNCIS